MAQHLLIHNLDSCTQPLVSRIDEILEHVVVSGPTTSSGEPQQLLARNRAGGSSTVQIVPTDDDTGENKYARRPVGPWLARVVEYVHARSERETLYE